MSATLRVEALETREVPAALSLTNQGAFGTINGAVFTQSSGGAAINSVVRLHAHGNGTVEQGYNTSARPLQYGENPGKANTHSEQVADVPAVTLGGGRYREFVLDVSEGRKGAQVSLDAFRIYVSDNPALAAKVQPDGSLPGATLAYDMGPDRWVALDTRLHTGGSGDAVVDVPEAALAGGAYVYLYSKFGEHIAASGGSETWGTRGPGGGPILQAAAAPAGVSGAVYVNGTAAPDGTVVYLVNYNTGDPAGTATVTNGQYTFAGVAADGTTQYQAQLPPQTVGGVDLNASSTGVMTFSPTATTTDLSFGSSNG